jgi:pyruvate kinase
MKQNMVFLKNKTKIVCTIGPASESREVMEKMLNAGMNVARLNFSHGDFESHKKVINNLRAASHATGKSLAIMADMSGPKMRIGTLEEEPIQLNPGDTFTLTTEDITGNQARVSVSFDRLPQAVNPGDTLYLNDGYIQLEVKQVDGRDVHCQVLVGGELRSRKGLNLPGIDLGISAFTPRDHECLKFALEHGVDAISQSFVESEKDIEDVRSAAKDLGYDPFIIAKIERSRARENLGGILEAADGIMIARGDLGVEIPIEMIAVAQKYLMQLANIKGKPVITATQMLESMTKRRLPTRAEATDVANAILDGTDCIMLSGESAMGDYPVDAVKMLAKIAAAIEVHRPSYYAREALRAFGREESGTPADLIGLTVESVLKRHSLAVVMVPTYSGSTARGVTRSRLPVWIVAISPQERTCQQLQFSYGVYPVHKPDYPKNWKTYAQDWVRSHGVAGDMVFLTERSSIRNPDVNARIELLDLDRK